VQRDPPVGAPAQRESLEARARGGGAKCKLKMANAQMQRYCTVLYVALSLCREREKDTGVSGIPYRY